MADSLLEEVRKAAPGADPVEINEVAADLIRQQAADLVVGLSRTRQENVRRVLAQAVRRGWSDTTTRRRLAQVVGLDPRRATAVEHFRDGQLAAGVPPGRAERQTQAYAKRLLNDRMAVIADHEIRTALQRAQRFAWADMQARGDYSPYAVRVTKVHKDERLCPVCRPQNGRRRSLKADITEGPPFHPRCRCEEEIVDQGIEKSVGPMGGDLYIPGPLQNMSVAYPGAPKKRRKKRKSDGSMDGMIEKAISPGGRPADASSLDRSPKKNWVENAGGLAKYIRMVAHALMRKGMPRDRAIQMAWGIVRNWAEGKGNVSPKVRAAAAKAVAEMDAKRAKTKVSKADQTTWNLADYNDILQQLTDDGVL